MMEFNLAKFKEMGANVRVLYLENDSDLREQMQKVLERFFTHIDALGNGQEGYECFLENKHELIITDIILPELNGIEIINKIKLKGYNPLIVVQSAYTDVEHMIDLIHLHIDHFTIKPFKNKEFVLKLYELVLQRYHKSSQQNEREENRASQSSGLEEIERIYDTIKEGIVVIQGNSIVRVNQAFLNLSAYADFETLKLEMPHIGTLFVVCPKCLDALDNKTFVKQLRKSDPAESTVYIANDGIYKEYMISCVELNDEQFVLTFSEITDVVKKYKRDVVTQLPNKFSIQRKLRLLNMENPEFNVILLSIKHFDVFINFYGKRIGNDLERFFVDRIRKILKIHDSKTKCYFAQYEQNKYIIMGVHDLEHLVRPIAKMHLNEFVISGQGEKTKDKISIDIDPVHIYKSYQSKEDVEIMEVEIINDFDELAFIEAKI